MRLARLCMRRSKRNSFALQQSKNNSQIKFPGKPYLNSSKKKLSFLISIFFPFSLLCRYGDLLADFERLSTLHNETTAKLSHQIETLESEIISTSEKYKTEVERTEVLEAKLVEKESSISQMESERKAFGEEQQKIQQSMQVILQRNVPRSFSR